MIEKKNHRLLIANRGEIASRIIRGAKDEGWHTIAIYSDADASAPHVLLADEAHPVGPAPAHQSYLNMDRILEVGPSYARQRRVAAEHQGEGPGDLKPVVDALVRELSTDELGA